MQIWCRCLLYVETVTSSRKYWLINAILFGSKLPRQTRNLLEFVQMEIIGLPYALYIIQRVCVLEIFRPSPEIKLSSICLTLIVIRF